MKDYFTIKGLRRFFETNANAVIPFWLLSLFVALAVTSPVLNILFEFKPKITDFSSHIISNAALNDLDISKRVSLFYRALFSIVIVCPVIFILANQFTRKAIHAEKETLKAVYALSLLGILAVLSGILMTNTDFSIYIVFLVAMFLLIEIRQNRHNQDVELILWPVLTALPFALLCFTFLKKSNYFEIIRPEFTIEKMVLPIDPFLLGFVIFLGFFSGILYWIQSRIVASKNVLFKASLPIIAVPAVLSLLLEVTNILNIRFGIVFNSQFLLYAGLLIVSFTAFFILLRKNKSDKKDLQKNIFEKYYLPLLLLGLALMITQPWRMISPENEFFETANHGLSIDHFFRYGSIPIVENFDAHMLSYQIFAYVYGFLNGYEPWAPFIYISYFYAIEILVVYYLFKKVLGAVNSFFVIMCLPILFVVLNEFALAGLLVLFVLKLIQDKSKRNFYWFWSISFFLCFYKLDIGFAATVSGIVAFFIGDYYQNKTIEFKKTAITGAISTGILVSIFVLLCLLKGIHPISRFQEFLLAAMSNQNWAVTKMGDMSHFIFRMAYLILPLATAIGAVTVFVKVFTDHKFSKRIKQHKYVLSAFIFFIYFALFFLINVPRGIVRHNFEYGNIVRITSTIPLALLMLALLFDKKRKLISFMVVFFGMYLIINANNVNFKNKNTTLFYQAINSPSFHEKFLDTEKFAGTRVRESFDVSEIKSFKKFLDAVLTSNETYYDFSSKNYYHALTERKNPAYLNQTPLMLNGDKAQEFDIESIKKNKVPLVLMPIKNNIWHAIDEVFVDYKYYKLSEYIFENYVPLYRMASFDIYVLKDKKANYLAKLNTLGFFESKATITDFNMLFTEGISKNNVAVTKDNAGLITVKGAGANPFIIGLVESLRKQNKIKESNLPSKLSFKVNALSAGNFKIYYNLNQGESFAEERMKEYPVTQSGDIQLDLDLPKTPAEIMFAINTSGVQLKEFSLASGSQSGVSNPEMIDYYLGEVPRLWAENSKEEVFANVQALGEIVTEASVTINKSQLKDARRGYYAVVELNSDVDLSGNIDIMENSEKKASYHFHILPGKHMYAVRLSNSFYWWNLGSQSKIMFSSPKAIEISKFSLLAADGTHQEIYKSNGLTLSNITDENWQGGLGLKYNMLLLDNAPQKEKLLKKFKKIKFKNGTIVTINGYNVAGNFINVYIKEDLKKYKEVAPYPNPIEFAE